MASILTLIRAWIAAGKPKPDSLTLGSYESWSQAVGGILQHAGIHGFLGNYEQFLQEADPIDTEIEAWFDALFDHFGTSPFTTNDAAKLVFGPAGWNDGIKESIPSCLNDVEHGKFAMMLGQMFRTYKGRRFGPDGLHVNTCGKKMNKVMWRLGKYTTIGAQPVLTLPIAV